MKEVEKIALAALLHDIGKFAQRADIPLREPFQKGEYGYKHSAYTAQVLQDYFNDIEGYHQYAHEHHVVGPTSDEESWIVAAADRLASGFEREEFESYNSGIENEDFKTQRLRGLFDEKEEYRIAPLDIDTLFYVKEKSQENEYKDVWESFQKDLEKLRKARGNQTTDLLSLDYLLKKYTTFIPSATTFIKNGYPAVKANIPLYDHLKATAIFAAAIKALPEEKRENIINYYRKTKPYREDKEFLLINGDFFGIQNFIFNDIETKAAAKVLRGKSAFVQILTKVIAFYIVEELGLSKLSIITDSAGKFEILAPNTDDIIQKLQNIQKSLDEYFITSFFGETGVGISFIECGLFDFIQKGKYLDLRDRLAEEVEMRKLHKFDFRHRRYEIDWEKDLNNQNQCFACKKKKGKERENIEKLVCDSCYRFIEIGKKLTNSKYMIITKDETSIEIFYGYYLKFLPKEKDPKGLSNIIAIYDISDNSEFDGFAKWEIGAYVATKDILNEEEKEYLKNQNQEIFEILSFENLASLSVQEGIEGGKRAFGIEALMSLKGDVDNMGKFLREQKFNSFAKFNFFSRMVDYFFSVYVPYLMRKKYPHTYTVFGGGDDLFVLGAWDEVIGLAKEVRQRFMEFSKGSSLSFSVGMVMSKPNKPISFIARLSEEMLEKSKEVENKDSVTLFDETMKWEDYLDDNGLMEDLEIFNDNTAFLYRLLYFVELSKKTQKDPKATIWKSKLRYSFVRNVELDEKSKQVLNNLDHMIEKYPKETKAYLAEFTYKRRKS